MKHMVSGSILNWADDRVIVWGAGLASMDDKVDARAQIRAVRGPLSQMIARKWRADCQPVYGDPALLLPRLYTPTEPERRHRFGIVPHYLDLQYIVSSWDFAHPDVMIIDPLRPVPEVINAITSCEAVLSSSLHGMIVAHAYGVPAARVTFGARIGGDGMKFADYELSVGLPVSDVVPFINHDDLRIEALSGVRLSLPQRINVDPLWEACPFKPM
jgi:hypothetical protein